MQLQELGEGLDMVVLERGARALQLSFFAVSSHAPFATYRFGLLRDVEQA